MRDDQAGRRPRQASARTVRSARGASRALKALLCLLGAALAGGGLVWLSVPHGAEAPSTPPKTPAAPLGTLPPHLMERFGTARARIAAGAPGEAVPVLREILAALPQSDADAAVRSGVNFALCVALMKDGKLDAALDAALAFLAARPDDGAHNLIAGTLCYEKGRYRDAVERLSRGLEKDPIAARTLTDDPCALRCQLAECYRVLGETDAALATIDGVLAEDPRHFAALKTRAGVAYGRREFARALEILDDLHARAPRDGAVVTQLVRAALELGNGGRAIEALTSYFAAGGTHGDDMQLLHAKALVAAGKAGEAVAAAGSLLVVNPDNDEAYFVLANAFVRSGKAELAGPFRERYGRGTALRSELERARTASSRGEPSSAAYYRARAFTRAGRLGPALKEFQEARRLAPRNSQIAAGLASLLAAADRLGDAQEGAEIFARDAAREGVPLAAEFFLVRAEIAWTRGDSVEACDALERAIGDARCQREAAALAARFALVERSPRILALALAPFGTASGLDPELQAWKAMQLYLEGKSVEAADTLEAAVQGLPEPAPVVLLGLGMACREAGRREKAADAFRRVVAKEELLRHAWEGLKATTESRDEETRAEEWLRAVGEIEGSLRAEWEHIRGVQEARASSQAFVRVARLRQRLGQPSRARSEALLARDVDPLNAEAHRLVVTLCTQPEEAFVRLHSLEALRRIDPSDTAVEMLRRNEYARLQFAAPEVR